MDFLSRDPMPVADHFMTHGLRAPPAEHARTADDDAHAHAGAGESARTRATAVGTGGLEVCEQCFACCSGKEALWKHARDEHGADARLQCPVAGCGRRFSSLSASAAHWSHHVTCDGQPVTYTCELCGRLSANQPAHDKHVAKEHPDARSALCGVCGRYAGDVRSLTAHVAADHGAQLRSAAASTRRGGGGGGGVGPVRIRRAIRCDICGKRYGNYRLMRSHRIVHDVQTPGRRDAGKRKPAAKV